MSATSLHKVFASVVLAALPAFALIEPETEGMDAVTRDDGTFLVGSPTYSFDRENGAGVSIPKVNFGLLKS